MDLIIPVLKSRGTTVKWFLSFNAFCWLLVKNMKQCRNHSRACYFSYVLMGERKQNHWQLTPEANTINCFLWPLYMKSKKPLSCMSSVQKNQKGVKSLHFSHTISLPPFHYFTSSLACFTFLFCDSWNFNMVVTK